MKSAAEHFLGLVAVAASTVVCIAALAPRADTETCANAAAGTPLPA
eukprot:SAG11_NODE_23845_length_382_cov_1.053004_1_plen_45_part_10